MPPKAAAAPVQKSASRFGRVKSNLKMGIVGLPNVGKSSLFNLMCDMQVCTRCENPF
jgi:tRNA U34 5-carboxymethylaminomethyl modifying GTPase MnmE/TrmE